MMQNKSRGGRSNDDPVSSDVEVAKLRLELRNVALEDLEANGIVHWDREDNVVRKGPEFYEKYAKLDIDN